MPTFKVWDLINGDEETAQEFGAEYELGAALRYAEWDEGDGALDYGLYYPYPQAIAVQDADGKVSAFAVRARFSGGVVVAFDAEPIELEES